MKTNVVIVQSIVQGEWWCKSAAVNNKAGLFAQSVVTFEQWIADLWELHGDGRLIIDDVKREILMRAAAEKMAREGVYSAVEKEVVRANVPMAAECVRIASGLTEFEQVINSVRFGQDVAGISAREREFVRMLACYMNLLDQYGRIEFGSAALALAHKGKAMFPHGVCVRIPDAPPLTWVQERFFCLCDGVDLIAEPASGRDGVGKAPSGVAIRFGCPSGELAEPSLIADIVEEQSTGTTIIITAKNPIDLFDCLEKRFGKSENPFEKLSEKRLNNCSENRFENDLSVRVRLSVQAHKSFVETDFGRVFVACYQCVCDDVWNVTNVADVLFSPFSGVTKAWAVQFDTFLRGDRLAQRDEVLQALRIASDSFSRLEELVSDPNADVLIGTFIQQIQADMQRSSAWRAEQMAALRVLHHAMSAAREAGVGMDACLAFLKRAVVPIAISSNANGAQNNTFAVQNNTYAANHVGDIEEVQVVITTQSFAAQFKPESFDVAVLADLTSESYPVTNKDDALTTFLLKYGLKEPESAIEHARREFSALLRLARKEIVLVRPLGDANADETYPAIVLEEFIDEYRLNPTQQVDIDNLYRLPPIFRKNLLERGEELLYANACASAVFFTQKKAALIVQPHIDDLAPGDELRICRRQQESQNSATTIVCFSPSQIEAYLECPFKWFVTRRLHPKALDEGFGPLERGIFAHAVMLEFYRRFQTKGFVKVDEQNLDEAKTLMHAVTKELTQLQSCLDPGERYAAVTELERREVQTLCNQLVDYLDFEAKLLPSFHPEYLEYEIDARNAVEFAGHSLIGTVDRIDIDDAGHAVIIDYKGSMSSEHEIVGKDYHHAGKVQTRIYARAIERALEHKYEVVAALYVRYGARPAVTGAYDPQVISATHLPGMRHNHCACGQYEEIPDSATSNPADFSFADLTFKRMLDETESLVEKTVSAMISGNIKPQPVDVDVCRYCMVLSCPKRGI